MKTKQYKSLGLTVTLAVPASVKEFDDNARKEGACLDEAINNVAYRSCLTDFRYLLIHGQEAEPAKDGRPAVPAVKGLEEITGIERKTKPSGKKNDKGEDIMVFDESEAEYLTRVCDLKKVERESFQPVADLVSKAIAFDASAAERKPAGPKKLPQMYRETAAAVIAQGNQPKLLALFKRDLGKDVVLTGDAAKDTEILGWAIKEHKAWRDKDDLAKNYLKK